ncbi:hypothetical protein HAX54_017543, partial [Datura stramonium]|nr:hypothetical protein [Datura stramonium]
IAATAMVAVKPRGVLGAANLVANLLPSAQLDEAILSHCHKPPSQHSYRCHLQLL